MLDGEAVSYFVNAKQDRRDYPETSDVEPVFVGEGIELDSVPSYFAPMHDEASGGEGKREQREDDTPRLVHKADLPVEPPKEAIRIHGRKGNQGEVAPVGFFLQAAPPARSFLHELNIFFLGPLVPETPRCDARGR